MHRLPVPRALGGRAPRLFVLLVTLTVVVGRVARADDLEAAKAHFAVAQTYYDEANYTDALKEFKEAYRLSKRPALLYNVGLCQERLDQLPEAIAAFEQYLREVPTASDRIQVQTRIANLTKRRDERIAKPPEAKADTKAETKPPEPAVVVEPKPATQPAVVEAKPAPAPPPSPDRPRKRIATWVVGGLGVGLLAGGLAAGLVAHSKYQNLDRQCPNGVCPAGFADEIAAGRRAGIAADVLWPIGAAAVVASVVLFFVEGKPRRAPAPAKTTWRDPGRRRAALSFVP